MKRKNISKKLRFEVLKRDDFRCKYCWKTPWEWVKLQIDHIIPVSKWWENEIENLLTACRDCNIWKWDRLITKKSSQRDMKEELSKLREEDEILQ